MSKRGWNGNFLEVGFTKSEAIALRDFLCYLFDHTYYRNMAPSGCPRTPDFPEAWDATVFEPLAEHLCAVVHQRTKA